MLVSLLSIRQFVNRVLSKLPEPIRDKIVSALVKRGRKLEFKLVTQKFGQTLAEATDAVIAASAKVLVRLDDGNWVGEDDLAVLVHEYQSRIRQQHDEMFNALAEYSQFQATVEAKKIIFGDKSPEAEAARSLRKAAKMRYKQEVRDILDSVMDED